MSLHRDLLEQARHLASRDRRRPRQANLRRAISSAYYAAFHLFVDEGAKLLTSGTAMPALYRMFARSFAHDEMKSVCHAVASGDWPMKVRANVGPVPIPPELRAIAERFVELQQRRHQADYDVMQTFTRSQAHDYIDAAERLFDDWTLIRRDPAAKVFLAAMFTSRKIKG
jgi:uncharacterized protein (UPF0332 family)